MTSLPTAPGERVTAFRPLLTRGRAAGWRLDAVSGTGVLREFTWRRDLDRSRTENISYGDGHVVYTQADGSTWAVPATSAKQVATVLEMAGALPPIGTLDQVGVFRPVRDREMRRMFKHLACGVILTRLTGQPEHCPVCHPDWDLAPFSQPLPTDADFRQLFYEAAADGAR